MWKSISLSGALSRAVTLVLVGALALAAGYYITSVDSPSLGMPQLTLEARAAGVVDQCKVADSRQRCYDEKIPKLMDVISMEEAFAVTRLVQKQDDSYWFCHPLAHKLSAREYHKDPTGWKTVMTRCPKGMCANGCLHGAIQEHFSSEIPPEEHLPEVVSELAVICEARSDWIPTSQEQSSCYHEMGHLSLYLVNANPAKAGALCDIIAIKENGRNFLQTCYEGLFMQIFQPREPDDFALVYKLIPLKENLTACDALEPGIEKGICWEAGWKDSVPEFCDSSSGPLRYACYRESWIVSDESIETPEGILAQCSYAVDPPEQKLCYNKIYFSLLARFEFNDARMREVCVSMPKALRGQCFANTASRFIETDKELEDRALATCDFAKQFGVEAECYKELAHYAGFLFQPDSPEQASLCAKIPAPWSLDCGHKK